MIVADCLESGYEYIAIKYKVLHEREDDIEYFIVILTSRSYGRLIKDIDEANDDLIMKNNTIQIHSMIGCHEKNRINLIQTGLDLNQEYIDDPYLDYND